MDNIPPQFANKLELMKPGAFVHHRSWGFGKVREWGAESTQMTIDFSSKNGHVMELEYAAESLTIIEPGHILAQKSTNLEDLRAQAAADPAGLMVLCVRSLGNSATEAEIQKTLSPDVIPAGEWQKWWNGAKRAMRKNGLFAIPTRKQEPIRILASPDVRGQQALEKFRAATAPKPLIAALAEVNKHWSDIAQDSVRDEIAEKLNQTITQLPKTRSQQLALAVEMAILRDEFLELTGLPTPTEGPSATISLLPSSTAQLGGLMQQLTASQQARILKLLAAAKTDAWPALFLELLPWSSGKMAETIMETFAGAGRLEEFVDGVQRGLRKRNLSSDFLYWLCKTRPEALRSLFEAKLLMTVLYVLEQDQLSETKRSSRLHDLLLTDKELIAAVLSKALLEDVRDITRNILLSAVFEELDRRSILATIVKLHPEVQPMIVGENAAESSALIVSWPSLEKRKAELEEITTKKIPANTKEVAIARSYGDLRENHEFKAAKEMQTVLMRRKAELEAMLARAQGTDFSNPDTSKVSLGTWVELRDKATSEKFKYVILGAWDSDPQVGIISYLTPLAKALLEHKPGETVQLLMENGATREAVIEKITAYKN